MGPLETTRSLFLRSLGVCHAIAFGSLAVQVRGLIGVHGILPAQEFMALARRSLGGMDLLRLPTLFWWGASDAVLLGACIAGLALSAALVAGVAPRWVLALLWADYLSLVTVGGVFLGFQWDALLLEATVMALPFAGAAAPPTRASVFLLRFLLFKLMLLSGLVKLASGDPSWRDLTALQFHFWTQPLPALPGWWMAQLPPVALRAMCGATLLMELALPFGVFGPRRARIVTCIGFWILQAVIGMTGNYGFFNLLTATLCLPLLDDDALRRVLPFLRQPPPPGPGRPRRPALQAAQWVGVGLAVALSTLAAVHRFTPLPAPLSALMRAVRPLESFNAYGLFAAMTTQRHEIRVEGSQDGLRWREYTFRDKPGPLTRPPAYVQPHQPRLDWQMWFAALGRCRHNPWFLSFAQALLEGRAPVTALLAANPFPDTPPRYLRTTSVPYAFTGVEERRSTGAFWKAQEERARPYCPLLTLEGGRLAALGDGDE